jgi:hypothetical protein
VLLLVGAAFAVVGGHASGRTAGPGAASTSTPLTAPTLPANPISNVISGGDFCGTARDAVDAQNAALSDPNADLAAMAGSPTC